LPLRSGYGTLLTMAERRIYLSPPHMTGREQEYTAEVIRSNWVAPVGPHLTKFEELFAERVGLPHAAAVTSGTAALHLALRILQVEPGDEVLCSTFTFIASANPILYEQATPVFIDSDEISWNLDPNLVEDELRAAAARGKLPKAIIGVDILGISADWDAIESIAAEFDVPVIEDAAEALGSTYKGRPAGGAGCCSIFSFNGNKIITTSGGGMLCSRDEQFVLQARHLATQARDPLPHYEHSQVGYNYRMSNVLAAVGLAQLEGLDGFVARRQQINAFYRERLAPVPGIRPLAEPAYGQANGWLSVIQVDADEFGATPDEIRLRLEQDNIESRRVWKPMHAQPVFAACRSVGGAVAEKFFETALCLPSGSALTDEDLERIVSCIESMA